MSSAIAAPVHTTVVGVFDRFMHARSAFEQLRRAGFADERIGFMGPDPSPEDEGETPMHVEEGAEIGAAIGAAAGGAAGLAVAFGLMTPLGPAIAGGAMIAWLASVGAGAAAGAGVGALVGLGIPEDEAHWYEGEMKKGRTLVTVHDADERAEDARAILRRHGARVQEPSDVGTYGSGLPATPY